MVVDYVLCILKHKYFDEDSELSFDEIIEQVQGTDLPLETKEWLREVMKPVNICIVMITIVWANYTNFFIPQTLKTNPKIEYKVSTDKFTFQVGIC